MYDFLAVRSSDLRFLYAWSFHSLQRVDDIYYLEAGTPLLTVRWFQWDFKDFMECLVRLDRAGLIVLGDDGDTIVPNVVGDRVWEMINPATAIMEISYVPLQ